MPLSYKHTCDKCHVSALAYHFSWSVLTCGYANNWQQCFYMSKQKGLATRHTKKGIECSERPNTGPISDAIWVAPSPSEVQSSRGKLCKKGLFLFFLLATQQYTHTTHIYHAINYTLAIHTRSRCTCTCKHILHNWQQRWYSHTSPTNTQQRKPSCSLLHVSSMLIHIIFQCSNGMK